MRSESPAAVARDRASSACCVERVSVSTVVPGIVEVMSRDIDPHPEPISNT